MNPLTHNPLPLLLTTMALAAAPASAQFQASNDSARRVGIQVGVLSTTATVPSQFTVNAPTGASIVIYLDTQIASDQSSSTRDTTGLPTHAPRSSWPRSSPSRPSQRLDCGPRALQSAISAPAEPHRGLHAADRTHLPHRPHQSAAARTCPRASSARRSRRGRSAWRRAAPC